MPPSSQPSDANAKAAITTYLDRIEKDLKAGHATEHTHRAALSALLDALIPGTTATNEPKRGKFGAPDYLITRGEGAIAFTLGYAEAKDVGVSLDDIEKTEQLQRYRDALPNLLLTDYLNFRWYVKGDKRDAQTTLGNWDGKKLNRNKDGLTKLRSVLDGFATQAPLKIGTASDLAHRMARLTALIREVTLSVLLKNEASQTLKDLLNSFRETMLPGLTNEDFADMYAQTLAYGLFAARVQHSRNPGNDLFIRQDAARNIPKTNPLLQKLFYTLTGPELDEEPYVTFVDDLAALLNHADIVQVLAEFGTQVREEDPIFYFYENFLAQYNPRLREQRGVYYTPTPVVDYIVRSVDVLLKRDFGLSDGLGDTERTIVTTSDSDGQPQQFSAPRLLITDPATGTGTFLYQIIRLLRGRYAAGENAGQWPAFVREHLIHSLYGFELMMAPYAIAHLKLSMELGGLDLPDATAEEQEERQALSVHLKDKDRLNVYLTNTLDDPQNEIQQLSGPFRAISDEAQAAGKIKADYPIMVVLGNPPYSGHSANKKEWIDDLLKGIRRDIEGKEMKGRRIEGNYYEVDGQPLGERNPKWLQDDYVKFIRWAQWRVEQTGAGIVAFITPHGYLDNPTFRGMRQSLSRTFDDIYVLDLHGNANKKEKAPDGGKDENVFDIRTGVAIGLFVRKPGESGPRNGKIHRADLWGDQDSKYKWLAQQDVMTGNYTELKPSKPMYLWADQDETLKEEYEQGWSLPAISPLNVMGFQSHRDDFAIAFDREEIERRIDVLRGDESDDVVMDKFGISNNRDWKVDTARKALKANKAWKKKIISVAYRPFDTRWSLYGSETMDYPRRELEDNVGGQENLCLGVGRQGSAIAENEWQLVTVSDSPMDANMYRRGGVNVFPLYLYPPPSEGLGLHAFDFPVDASGRTPNLSKAFVAALSKGIGLQFAPDGKTGGDAGKYTPEDVFHYIYTVLHSPSYRTRYADFLRSDFPRIPLPDTAERFRALAALGKELAGLHLLKTAPRLGGFPKAGDNVVAKGYPKFTPPEANERVGKVMISPQQWFTDVPPEVWAFRVGGYQVAEKWLKDRRGRVLSFEDVQHYQKTLGALLKTLNIMVAIDEAAQDFWNPTSIYSLNMRLSKDIRLEQKDIETMMKIEDSDPNSSIIRFTVDCYDRVKLITGDDLYASKWFYISNPSIDGKTPMKAILDGESFALTLALDKLENAIGLIGTKYA
ncbi:type ISP restriction/modification enzyme [Deinococcus sp. AJ005]|uniref:type ISP restriction/modification enzyme n=1 Tax=Deinococcus sp. AJ005 TaxID=2652443 RepID=UPI001865867B|nr:type ISP restriction/modification enzyme [Deinococcus sp. AJ005]